MASAHVVAVLHHFGGDVVVVHALSVGVDAGEAGVVRACPVVVRLVDASALAAVPAIVA